MIVHLVDGTYELFRHFYGQRRFNKGDDKPLGAVVGVLTSLVEILEQDGTHIGVATDHVIESFRNDLWPGYKTGAGIDRALVAQFHPLEEAIALMGVTVWAMTELEADDALASAARIADASKAVDKVCIWTPDKDLAQCVRGDRVVQVDRKSKTIRNADGVKAKFGVEPRLIPDWLALVGDAADGYPGIPGSGRSARRSCSIVSGRSRTSRRRRSARVTRTRCCSSASRPFAPTRRCSGKSMRCAGPGRCQASPHGPSAPWRRGCSGAAGHWRRRTAERSGSDDRSLGATRCMSPRWCGHRPPPSERRIARDRRIVGRTPRRGAKRVGNATTSSTVELAQVMLTSSIRVRSVGLQELRRRRASLSPSFDDRIPMRTVTASSPRRAASPLRPQRLAMLLAIGAAWPLSQAVAQQVAPDPAPQAGLQLEQVNVTAQRRTENYKDVPISATVLNPETLETLSTSGQDIRVLAGKVPSLNIESSNGRTFPRVYIRGYGNTDFNTYASQPVSLVYDDIVQENAILKGFPIFDLENVEVLRGPQGSLFGRNTPAGVVKFNSVRPVIGATDGYASISFGSLATTNFEAASSVPLGQDFALRASILGEHRRDWVTISSADRTNLYNGQNTEGYDDGAARLQLLYQPTAQFNALFNVHARSLSGTARVFRANIIKKGTNDLVDNFNENVISINGKNQQNLRTAGANANLNWNLGPVSLHSITGYETIGNYFTRGDIDGGDSTNTPFPVETAGGVTDHKQLTQEFRVASETAGPFSWQTGLYFFFEDLTAASYGYRSSTGAQTSYATTTQINTAYAAFASGTYDLTKDLNLRAGVRYTDDRKTFTKRVGFTDPGATKLSASKVTGDVAGTYKLDTDLSVYARVASGFRGASFGSPTSGQVLTSAKPETNTSYEVGIKADLLGRRARVNFDVYHFDVKDQQLTAVGGSSNIVQLLNAKKSTGNGAEMNLEALITDRFKASVGASYNKTEIKDSTLSVAGCGSGCAVTDSPVPGRPGFYYINGNALPQAPKIITYATAKYTMPVANGDVSLSGDVSYRSKINLFLYESTEFTGRSLTEAGLRLGYRWGEGRYEAAVFCRNCTNQLRVNGAIDFNNLEGFINDPARRRHPVPRQLAVTRSVAHALALCAIVVACNAGGAPRADALPASKTAMVFGQKIRYLDVGHGPTVVLVHGLGSSARGDWGKVLPTFAAHHRVVALDLPGFGASDKPFIQYNIQTWVDFVGEFLRQRKVGSFTLVGESLGGWIAARYTIQALDGVAVGRDYALPKPSKLVLCDAAGFSRASVARIFDSGEPQQPTGLSLAGQKRLLASIFHDPAYSSDAGLRTGMAWAVSKGDGWTIQSFRSNRSIVAEAVEDQLATITIPTLVVWGRYDQLVPIADGEGYAAGIPNAKLIVIPDAGHAPMIETPAAFIEAVEGFL